MKTIPTSEKLLLRVDEAAALCGLSRAFMYKIINRGEVPVIRIGRTTRIPRVWLENWIASQVDKWQQYH